MNYRYSERSSYRESYMRLCRQNCQIAKFRHCQNVLLTEFSMNNVEKSSSIETTTPTVTLPECSYNSTLLTILASGLLLSVLVNLLMIAIVARLLRKPLLGTPQLYEVEVPAENPMTQSGTTVSEVRVRKKKATRGPSDFHSEDGERDDNLLYFYKLPSTRSQESVTSDYERAGKMESWKTVKGLLHLPQKNL